MENPSNIIPDQLILLEGDAGLVPKASSGDVGKVLGVLNSSGDVGWVPDQEGMAQVQADWDQTDSSQVSYIANKPNLSVYATTSAMETALAGKQDTISDLSDIRAGAAAGATAVQPSALNDYATTSAMNTALAGKQDVINDLSDIRAGAAKGDTAVQPAALDSYATTSAMNTALAGKQDVISDLDTIRAGAAAGATAAQPSDLPSSDELVPSASSGDSGKVLTVDNQGNPAWITPSAGTVYTPGDGVDITNNVISADVDGTTIGIDSTTKKIKSLQTIPTKTSDLQNDSNFVVSSSLATVATSGSYADLSNKPTIPSVDQTYSAVSTNAQSGVAVAQAIAAIPSSSYTAGDAIDITNNEISVAYDSDTLDSATPLVTNTVYIDTLASVYNGRAYEPDSSTRGLIVSGYDDDRSRFTAKLHIPGGSFYFSNYPSNVCIKLSSDYYFDHTSYLNPVNDSSINTAITTTFNSTDNRYWVDEQDIDFPLPLLRRPQHWVFYQDNPDYSNLMYLMIGQRDAGGTGALASISENASAPTITLTYQQPAGGTVLSVKNPLPASTSADENKVLKVNASGNAEWGTVSAGGGVSTVTVPDITYVDSVASVDSTLFTLNDFTVSVKGTSQSAMNVLLSHPTLTNAYVVSQYYGTNNGSSVAYSDIKTYVIGAKTTHPSVSGAYVYQPQDLTTPINLQTTYDTVSTTAGLPTHFDVEVMYNDGGSAKTFSFKLQIWSDIVEKTAWHTTYALRARVFISAA